MTDQNNEAVDLKALETRVDELINTVDKLTSENTALKSQQNNLVTERAELIEKTELARTRIESMISRLRAMETRP
jgi:cell division protein ZapB